MGSSLEEVQANLGGKWILERSENFEQALQAMGLNILVRKIANHVKPTIEIRVQGDKVVIVAKAAFFSQTFTFPLNENYEQEYEGIKMKCLSKWEDSKLITEATPLDPDKHKPQIFHRELVNGELVQTMWIGDVKCVRVFKKET